MGSIRQTIKGASVNGEYVPHTEKVSRLGGGIGSAVRPTKEACLSGASGVSY